VYFIGGEGGRRTLADMEEEEVCTWLMANSSYSLITDRGNGEMYSFIIRFSRTRLISSHVCPNLQRAGTQKVIIKI
jgi:hypothetical protein